MQSATTFYIQWARPVIAEYFSQLLFTFLHSSAVSTILNPRSSVLYNNALVPAISDGLTVIALIVLFGHISGCHINFSVTIAIFIGGGISWKKVPLYLIAQVLGSLSGAGIALVTNGGAYGQFSLNPDVSPERGYLMEVIQTLILILAVLMSAIELRTSLATLGVGCVVVVNILGGFNISGGCMNPTLSIGLAVVSGEWTNYWVYWAGPLTGAIFAAFFFRFFLSDKVRLICQESANPPSTPCSVKAQRKTSFNIKSDLRL